MAHINCFISFQILTIYDSVDAINVDKAVEYISSLQQQDGSFVGDKWGKCLGHTNVSCTVETQ